MLKDSLVTQLQGFIPDVTSSLRWSNAEAPGALPANFQFATVQSISAIGTSFLRVRVKLPDLSLFSNDSIHFRFALPPQDLDIPDWPYTAENGRTIWPKGDKALHRPVYTSRWIDQEAELMDFDVFLHDGGRVTNWAQTARPGSRIALPAAARILESLTDDASGHVTFLTDEGADLAYPVTAPSGVSITWLRRSPKTDFAALTLDMYAERPQHFLWFATERSETLQVRAALKVSGPKSDNKYIAFYWSR